MNKEKFQTRTDLAIESDALNKSEIQNNEIEGVSITIEKDLGDDITVTWVEIKNEKGSKTMGKPIGNYITIESEIMKQNSVKLHENIIKIMADKLSKLKKLNRDTSILVVGLGNWNITPDALGPKVISKVLVTRHLLENLPEEIDKSVRMVSAISTGVMGLTGMETGEIVKGIVENIKPDVVIAIDALAARKTSRINTTIQISDTGISPGSGVGNTRMALNEKTLGVPVLAIGVPTVVDAATMVNDTMDRILDEMSIQAKKGSQFYNMLQSINEEEKYSLILDILEPYSGNMFVTPKEVDSVVDGLADIIGNAINIALHPGIDIHDINRYVYA